MKADNFVIHNSKRRYTKISVFQLACLGLSFQENTPVVTLQNKILLFTMREKKICIIYKSKNKEKLLRIFFVVCSETEV